MARKPIKKRTQRKHVPPPFGAEEAKIFDIPKPPIGLTYQWVLAEHVRRYPGWVQVPFDRHESEMPADTNEDGAIVYLGNMLVQQDQSLVQAYLALPRNLALKNLQEHSAYSGNRRGSPQILSESFIVSSNYPSIPSDSPPIDVDITIKFRVSARWQDAAAALGLDVQEYARRRLIMENILLAPYGYREDRAYEPVELQITRKDS